MRPHKKVIGKSVVENSIDVNDLPLSVIEYIVRYNKISGIFDIHTIAITRVNR